MRGSADRWSIQLDADACGLIDVLQEWAIALGKILVYRLPGTAPVAVIIDDQDTATGQPWIECFQLHAGGFVPVSVEPQDRYQFRQALAPRQSLRDVSLDEFHPRSEQPHGREVGLYLLDRRVAPIAAIASAGVAELQLCGLAAVINIDAGRLS